QRCLRRLLEIAIETGVARSGDSDDLPGQAIDTADPIVLRIGDKESTIGGPRYVRGRLERHAAGRRRARGEVDARGAARLVELTRIETTNHAAARIAKHEIAVRRDRQGAGAIEV